jgi:hypothetical protein
MMHHLLFYFFCCVHTCRFATYDGIDACGSRLADEVRGLVAAQPSLSRVSIVAHSMGGLMARCGGRGGAASNMWAGGSSSSSRHWACINSDKEACVCKQTLCQHQITTTVVEQPGSSQNALHGHKTHLRAAVQVRHRAAVQPCQPHHMWAAACPLCHAGHATLRLRR